MNVRIGSHPAREALAWMDGVQPEEGLLFAPQLGLADWDAVERELTEAFHLTQAATAAGAPVVYLLDADALLGRAAPLDSAVAAGLSSGVRALAFEGQRKGRYATAVAATADVLPDRIADAVSYLTTMRAANGQTLMLGDGHLGAMLP